MSSEMNRQTQVKSVIRLQKLCFIILILHQQMQILKHTRKTLLQYKDFRLHVCKYGMQKYKHSIGRVSVVCNSVKIFNGDCIFNTQFCHLPTTIKYLLIFLLSVAFSVIFN
jgi:hypothetical protein